MVLINGAEGIGTGWSSSVPNYNPRDVVDNLKAMMKGEQIEPMHPWYRGYKGTLVPADGKGSYTSYGTVSKAEGGLLHISELEHHRVNDVSDVIKEGDIVKFKVTGRDPRSGKLKLSRKVLLPKPE